MSEVPIREARAHFADIIDRAIQDEPTVISRRGEQVAAVVPIHFLRQYEAWEEAEIRRLVAERKDEPTYTLAEVMEETLRRAE